MKLVPLGDRVVLKQFEAEETTKSGIILTSNTQEKPQETGEAAFDEPKTIVVTVNDSSVEMTGKSGYTFVDIFDFYPFDLKTAGGTELVTRVNGEKAAFNAPLAAGDKIELYWR